MDRIVLPESQSFYARAIRWCVEFILTPGRLEQFLRYTFVSFIALALDLTAFAILISTTTVAVALAGAISNMIGLVLHYYLSVSMVFDRSQSNKSERNLILEYMITGAVGFAITAIVILITVDIAGLPAFLGKGFGVGANFVSVYLIRAGYVFAVSSELKTDQRLPG
jgi:putative flippase GtrA